MRAFITTYSSVLKVQSQRLSKATMRKYTARKNRRYIVHNDVFFKRITTRRAKISAIREVTCSGQNFQEYLATAQPEKPKLNSNRKRWHVLTTVPHRQRSRQPRLSSK
jgi:hypothetical protein